MVFGEIERDADIPRKGRFVVLKHDWPEPHRDLIVELRNTVGAARLPTWALYPERPDDRFFPSNRALAGRAVALEFHRREYLEYEGPVSGDRGSVQRECRGVVIDSDSDPGGDRIRIALEVFGPGEIVTPGELWIERKPESRLIRDIQVGRNHAEAAASGHVFEWRPERAGRSTEDGGVA